MGVSEEGFENEDLINFFTYSLIKKIRIAHFKENVNTSCGEVKALLIFLFKNYLFHGTKAQQIFKLHIEQYDRFIAH